MIDISKIIDEARIAGEVNEFDWKKGVAAAAIGLAAATSPIMTGTADARSAAHGLPHQRYSEQDIVNAIIGEASDQGYEGMLAIASAIRNRMKEPYYKNNVLHGVYGLHAKHIKSEPQSTVDMAKKAWDESAAHDTVGGAYIWGSDSDIQKFQQQSWFKNVVKTVRIGGHTFFKKR